MFLQNLKLLFLTLLLFGVAYPLLVWALGQTSPDKAAGSPVEYKGRVVGLANVGQPFDSVAYFWSRPSAVNYNGAATGGSNQGPTNPAHLQLVAERTAAYLKAHPQAMAVPAEMVTASGGGLDPHITPAAALQQVTRVAAARHLPEATVQALVQQHTQQPVLGLLGPATVNVLQLNLSLDQLR